MTTAADAIERLVGTLRSDHSPRLKETSRPRIKETTGAGFAFQLEQATQRLLHAHVEPGSTVVFAVRPSVAAMAHLCALLRIGARVVLVDLRDPPALVRSKLDRVSPDFVLTEPRIALVSRRFVRWLLAPWLSIPDIRDLAPTTLTTRSAVGPKQTVPLPQPNDEALVVFTSGTTEAPKAVVHTQKSLAFMLKSLIELMGEANGETVYSDQFHSLIPALASGASCIIGALGGDSDQVALLLNRHEVTTWFTTPTSAATIDRVEGSRLQRIVVGSAPVTAQFVEEMARALPSVEVIGVYAMSEATPVAVARGHEIIDHEGRGTLLGSPVPGVDVVIRPGGEIVVSGDRVGSYLGEPPAPVRTGDLGHFDSEGRLVLDGRSKNMIITDARNIYPEHHEPGLRSVEGVCDVAMVGLPDELGDEELWLVVDLCPGANQTTVRKALEASEDASSLPVAGILFERVPRSGRSNKVDRAAARALVGQVRSPSRNEEHSSTTGSRNHD